MLKVGDAMATLGYDERYVAERSIPGTSLRYGLERRTRKLLESIARHGPAGDRPLDVIDFGCADATMLVEVAHQLGDRHGSGLGLDVFASGVPLVEAPRGLRFQQAKLFQHPYAVPDASCDIAVVSAFIKHHPKPERFLGEVARILRPDGIAVLLDPRPFVVRVGILWGRFSRHSNPSPWSAGSMERLIRRTALPLELVTYDRYWLAPTIGIYRLGVERWCPAPLRWHLALHQSLVLRRAPLG